MLAKPTQSNLKDAHFQVSGKIIDNGVTVVLKGDGVFIYKPKFAGRFTSDMTVGSEQVTIAEITLDGTNYGKSPGATKWTPTKSDKGFDPSIFEGASEQKYIGEENLSQGKAWHASAKDRDGNPFDAYIRQSDGYPIKYVQSQSGGQNITLTFDHYNTGESVSAPPAEQIEQG